MLIFIYQGICAIALHYTLIGKIGISSCIGYQLQVVDSNFLILFTNVVIRNAHLVIGITVLI
ncbi:hypothetical protein V1522DRAFT_410719 [Lipomyces starkeyi]